MPHHTARRRGLALAALSTSLGLLASAPALTSVSAAVPAAAGAPTADCAVAFPVDELVAGQPVEGLTVVSGTTPTAFTGTVIGVLQDGIAPDVDMVMMELSSPRIDQVGGIWQGMSGSPVYAADGRLIGAVAYGLANGTTKVAGITPYADMDDYRATAPSSAVTRVPAPLARAIATRTDVSVAQARQGVRQLPMPTGVSGASAARLEQTRERSYLPRSTYAVGRAQGAAAPTAETMVAGGSMAAAVSYGDIAQVGVGTVTSVCDGEVVGFGHPMYQLGSTSMSLHPADVLYVQEDPLGVPFKVANVGGPVGTVTDDRRTGLTGSFGAVPETLDVTSTVTYGERSRTGKSFVTVDDAAAATTFYQNVANHDRVVDGVLPGSETQDWTITGTDVDGSAFTIEHSDRFASDYDITESAAYGLPDLVATLTSVRGVDVDTVSSEVAVSADAATYSIRRVQQRRKGAWVTLSDRRPAVVTAGQKLRLRVVLSGAGRTRHNFYTFAVPRGAAGGDGIVVVTAGGGGDGWYGEEEVIIISGSTDGGLDGTGGDDTPSAATIARELAAAPRNDQTSAQLFLQGRRTVVRRSAVARPVDRVVRGYVEVSVRVRR